MWVLHLFGWLFPALLSVVGWLVGGPAPQSELYPYRATCWYLTTDQIYPDLALTVLYFLTFILMFVLERRAANYTIIEAPPGECGVDSSADTPKDDCSRRAAKHWLCHSSQNCSRGRVYQAMLHTCT